MKKIIVGVLIFLFWTQGCSAVSRINSKDGEGKIDWLKIPTNENIQPILSRLFRDIWGEDYDQKVKEFSIVKEETLKQVEENARGVYKNKQIMVGENEGKKLTSEEKALKMWNTIFHELGHADKLYISNNYASILNELNVGSDNDVNILAYVLSKTAILSQDERRRTIQSFYAKKLFSEAYAIFSSLYAGYKLKGKYCSFPLDKYYDCNLLHYGEFYAKNFSGFVYEGADFGYGSFGTRSYFVAESFVYLVIERFRGDLEATKNYLRKTAVGQLVRDMCEMFGYEEDKNGSRMKKSFNDVRRAAMDNFHVSNVFDRKYTTEELNTLNVVLKNDLRYYASYKEADLTSSIGPEKVEALKIVFGLAKFNRNLINNQVGAEFFGYLEKIKLYLNKSKNSDLNYAVVKDVIEEILEIAFDQDGKMIPRLLYFLEYAINNRLVQSATWYDLISDQTLIDYIILYYSKEFGRHNENLGKKAILFYKKAFLEFAAKRMKAEIFLRELERNQKISLAGLERKFDQENNEKAFKDYVKNAQVRFFYVTTLFPKLLALKNYYVVSENQDTENDNFFEASSDQVESNGRFFLPRDTEPFKKNPEIYNVISILNQYIGYESDHEYPEKMALFDLLTKEYKIRKKGGKSDDFQAKFKMLVNQVTVKGRTYMGDEKYFYPNYYDAEIYVISLAVSSVAGKFFFDSYIPEEIWLDKILRSFNLKKDSKLKDFLQ